MMETDSMGAAISTITVRIPCDQKNIQASKVLAPIMNYFLHFHIVPIQSESPCRHNGQLVMALELTHVKEESKDLFQLDERIGRALDCLNSYSTVFREQPADVQKSHRTLAKLNMVFELPGMGTIAPCMQEKKPFTAPPKGTTILRGTPTGIDLKKKTVTLDIDNRSIPLEISKEICAKIGGALQEITIEGQTGTDRKGRPIVRISDKNFNEDVTPIFNDAFESAKKTNGIEFKLEQ